MPCHVIFLGDAMVMIADCFACRERQNWRCSHCRVWGHAVWAVRDGPNGPRVCFILLIHYTVERDDLEA